MRRFKIFLFLLGVYVLRFVTGEDYECEYKDGNGVGKREYRVGKINSPDECTKRCIAMRARRSDVNGVIYSPRYRVCYCIASMLGRRRNPIWKSCFLIKKGGATETAMTVEARARAFTCSYKSGFGFGGSQYFIGPKENELYCAADCYDLRNSKPNINGASFGIRNSECICESNMKGRERNYQWKSCYLKSNTPTARPSPTPIRPRSTIKPTKKKRDRKRKKGKRRKNRKKNKKRKKTTTTPKQSTKMSSTTQTTKQASTTTKSIRKQPSTTEQLTTTTSTTKQLATTRRSTRVSSTTPATKQTATTKHSVEKQPTIGKKLATIHSTTQTKEQSTSTAISTQTSLATTKQSTTTRQSTTKSIEKQTTTTEHLPSIYSNTSNREQSTTTGLSTTLHLTKPTAKVTTETRLPTNQSIEKEPTTTEQMPTIHSNTLPRNRTTKARHLTTFSATAPTTKQSPTTGQSITKSIKGSTTTKDMTIFHSTTSTRRQPTTTEEMTKKQSTTRVPTIFANVSSTTKQTENTSTRVPSSTKEKPIIETKSTVSPFTARSQKFNASTTIKQQESTTSTESTTKIFRPSHSSNTSTSSKKSTSKPMSTNDRILTEQQQTTASKTFKITTTPLTTKPVVNKTTERALVTFTKLTKVLTTKADNAIETTKPQKAKTTPSSESATILTTIAYKNNVTTTRKQPDIITPTESKTKLSTGSTTATYTEKTVTINVSSKDTTISTLNITKSDANRVSTATVAEETNISNISTQPKESILTERLSKVSTEFKAITVSTSEESTKITSSLKTSASPTVNASKERQNITTPADRAKAISKTANPGPVNTSSNPIVTIKPTEPARKMTGNSTLVVVTNKDNVKITMTEKPTKDKSNKTVEATSTLVSMSATILSNTTHKTSIISTKGNILETTLGNKTKTSPTVPATTKMNTTEPNEISSTPRKADSFTIPKTMKQLETTNSNNMSPTSTPAITFAKGGNLATIYKKDITIRTELSATTNPPGRNVSTNVISTIENSTKVATTIQPAKTNTTDSFKIIQSKENKTTDVVTTVASNINHTAVNFSTEQIVNATTVPTRTNAGSNDQNGTQSTTIKVNTTVHTTENTRNLSTNKERTAASSSTDSNTETTKTGELETLPITTESTLATDSLKPLSSTKISEMNGTVTTLATKLTKTKLFEGKFFNTTVSMQINTTKEATQTTNKGGRLSNRTSIPPNKTNEIVVRVKTRPATSSTENDTISTHAKVTLATTESTMTKWYHKANVTVFVKTTSSNTTKIFLHSTSKPLLKNLTTEAFNSQATVDNSSLSTTKDTIEFTTEISNTRKPTKTTLNATKSNIFRNITTSRPITTTTTKVLATKHSTKVESTSEWTLHNKKYEFKEFVCDHGIMRIVLSINPNIDTHFAHNVTLRDPQCAFMTSSIVNNEIILVTDYEKCGATVDEDEKYIVYKNQIFDWTTIDLSNDEKIFRPMELTKEVHVHCKVEKNYDTSLDGSFKPKHSSVVQITKTKYGKMELSMSLYKSFEFNKKYITREFPVVIDMTDHLYVELAMNTTSKGLLLSPQHCYATVTSDPEDTYRYSVFKERCPRDTTFDLVKKSNTRFRFRIKVFDFLKSNKGIYMHCASTICESKSTHPVCQFGCEAIRSDRKHKRTDLLDHKNSVSEDIYTVSSGFIEVKDRKLGNDVEQSKKLGMKDDEDISITSNKTFLLLLIILCVVTLIAVVSLSAAVIFYHQRRRQQGNDSSSQLVTHL